MKLLSGKIEGANRMKLIFLVLTLMMTFSTTSYAAGGGSNYPWNVPANVRIVQKAPVDNVRIFSSIQSAMNSITDASQSNQYQIKIMPGTYNIGSASITMKEFVDIEGSGVNVTKITGSNNPSGMIIGASNAELRSTTIESTGGDPTTIVISNQFASPSLTNLNIIANNGLNVAVLNQNSSNPKFNNVAITVTGDYAHAMQNSDGSSPVLTDVLISASGVTSALGLYNYAGSFPVLKNTTINVTGGTGISSLNASFTMTGGSITVTSGGSQAVNVTGGNIQFNGVSINALGTSGSIGVIGQVGAVINLDSSSVNATTNTLMLAGGTILVANTKLVGGPVSYNSSGVLKCTGVYDGDYNSVICP